jgi:predicted ATPase
MERSAPFISRVRLKNFKSIAECDVRLGPLTMLVGPNGSGKSNFLQALALLGRAVNTTPYEAINGLGGLGEIVRRVPEPADSFSIDVEAVFSWGSGSELSVAEYGFEIGFADRRGPRPIEVIRESCVVRSGGQMWSFSAERGSVQLGQRALPPPDIESDRLYLPVAASRAPYNPLHVGLASMQFYNLALESLRELTIPSPGAILERKGEFLGDTLGALDEVRPDLKQRVDSYLSAVVPGIAGVDRDEAGRYVTVVFRAVPGADGEETEFGPEAVSDGTIRAAGVLVALFQLAATSGRIPLVGIEEPELALHPAAAGVLFDALTEASEHVQVLVTTQSPDLLDRDDVDVSMVRAVTMRDGLTVIGEVDQASRQIVRGKRYTLGELMRGNQLTPRSAPPGSVAEREA